MKKGIIRMVIGSVMIGFQLLSIYGSIRAGKIVPFLTISGSSLGQVGFDISYLLGYYAIGIIGTVLLISGIYAYNK